MPIYDISTQKKYLNIFIINKKIKKILHALYHILVRQILLSLFNLSICKAIIFPFDPKKKKVLSFHTIFFSPPIPEIHFSLLPLWTPLLQFSQTFPHLKIETINCLICLFYTWVRSGWRGLNHLVRAMNLSSCIQVLIFLPVD